MGEEAGISDVSWFYAIDVYKQMKTMHVINMC